MAEEEYYRRHSGRFPGQKERALPVSRKRNPQTPLSVAHANSVESPKKEVERLTKQLEELKKELQNVTTKTPRSNDKYCAFCRAKDHYLPECPHNPPRNACFDCLQPNLRRGHEGCPGPTPRNNEN